MVTASGRPSGMATTMMVTESMKKPICENQMWQVENLDEKLGDFRQRDSFLFATFVSSGTAFKLQQRIMIRTDDS